MWKINNRFIESQVIQEKTFYFSHNPNDIDIIGIGSFYFEEIELLKRLVQQKYNKTAKFVQADQYWKLEW